MVFLEEVRIFCPVVYNLVLGACGIQESDVKIKGATANSIALASAIMCRLRNPKASALHYRISTVMFHSGAKHEDLVRLNRLGVSRCGELEGPCMGVRQLNQSGATIQQDLLSNWLSRLHILPPPSDPELVREVLDPSPATA